MGATSLKGECAGASEYYQWRCLPLSIDVLCANDLLETIRAEAVNGFISPANRETGGILFGRQTEQSIEILVSQPLECEQRTGPSFILSEKDEVALREALAGPKAGSLQPVGLYMTRVGRGFSVTEAEREILNRYFREPWQMVLLLTPANPGPTRAGFFVRSPGYESGYVCEQYLLLKEPERRGNTQEPERADLLNGGPGTEEIPAPLAAAAGTAALGGPIAEDAGEQEVWPSASEDIHRASSAEPTDGYALAEETREPGIRWKMVATAALVILAAALTASLWTRSGVFPWTRVALQIGYLGPNLRIAWDPSREPFLAATGAVLEIHDGNSSPQYLPISRDDLDDGRIFYGPRFDKTDVRLKLLNGKQTLCESELYLIINPLRSGADGPVAGFPAATPQDEASLSPAPLLEPQSQEPALLPRESPIETRDEVPTRTNQPSARGRIVARTFSPPFNRSSGGTEVAAQPRLPELPEIHAAQPPLAIPPPSAPPIALRPPPPPVARQIPEPLPSQPRSGRLIWTGDLRKNGLLALSPAGASQGVLNGQLPGFPVKLSVQPAELLSGGMAIFSSDQGKAGMTEPPSALNGWNVVVYKWDPKRATEISIIEPPRSSNSWKRLVLGAGSRNVSVLVVDWQRDGSQ